MVGNGAVDAPAKLTHLSSFLSLPKLWTLRMQRGRRCFGSSVGTCILKHDTETDLKRHILISCKKNSWVIIMDLEQISKQWSIWKDADTTVEKTKGMNRYLRKSSSFCCNRVKVSSSMFTWANNSGSFTEIQRLQHIRDLLDNLITFL